MSAQAGTALPAGRRTGRRRGSRVPALGASVVAVALVSGCSLERPVGPSPTRYVDEVFSSVSIQRDLAYGSALGRDGRPQTLLLDLYTPTGDTTTRRRPAVIWVHGGGFAVGSKTASNVVALATTFAKRGYIAASADYRLLASSGCGGNPTPTQECINAALGAQHDIQAAVRWMRTHADEYNVDPTASPWAEPPREPSPPSCWP